MIGAGSATVPQGRAVVQERVRAVDGELLEDREVSDPNEDRLDHQQIAEQLADLALSVPDPSNIALYGPWGSGKSGIGNLVQKQLAQHEEIGFARFDAFKYAENPLRRNFISAVATALKIDDDEFHKDLYTGKTTTDFSIPPMRLVQLAVTFLALAVVICIGLLAIIAGIAAIQAGPFGDDFRSMSKQVVNAALAPAALLSALIVLAGRSLGIERKTDKAESDEQFEQVFGRLIDKAKKRRIIVFVDELDRCASADVVATLDAVRTFLGIKGCVFIVAADRQVLEEALTTDARQATPSDTVNPYYSAGSAYLDKVFQYQLIVPPLLQHSVTRFAAELVSGRPGVWSELGSDLDLTVSILVPSHVRSPRRVKNLLNAFVLAYRLAEARRTAGLLDTDIKERADEIARLVCFRVEFPLFARHLVMDARLPEYVLRLYDGPNDAVWEDFPHTSEEVRRVAEDFAGLCTPVATLLSEEETSDEDEDTSTRDRPVEQKHGRQLLEYLSRTRTVRGPGRDLLHLQSTGSVVGLDAQIAERIERGATNGDVRSIERTLDELDLEGMQGVLTLLIEQSRAAIGLEARNVATTILTVGDVPGIDLAARADAVADALVPALEAFPDLLSVSTLGGAWRIGLVAHRTAGRQLRMLVLGHSELMTNKAIGLLVIASAAEALDASRERTSHLVAAHLISDHAAETADGIAALVPDVATRLLRESREQVASSLRNLLAEVPVTPDSARTAGDPAPETEQPPDPALVLDALGGLLGRLRAGHNSPAQALVSVLLDVDHARIRDLVEPHFAAAGPIEDPMLSAQALGSCVRRHVSRWPTWLATVTPVSTAQSAADKPLADLMARLWTEATRDDKRPAATELEAAGTALLEVVEHRAPDRRPSIEDAVQKSLAGHVTDDDSAAARLKLHDAARPLLAVGVLLPSVLAQREVVSLIGTLHKDLPEQSVDSDLVNYATRTVVAAIAGWPGTGPEPEPPSDADVTDLLHALYACTWLPEPHATGLPLIARATATGIHAKDLPGFPPAAVIADFRDEYGAVADAAVAAWITLAEPDVDDLQTIVPKVIVDHPSADVLTALKTLTSHIDNKSRVALLASVVDDPNAPVSEPQVLAAVATDETPDTDIARLIISRYGKCGNNTQRRQVLELWARSGITTDTARRNLIKKILIPLFNLNADGGNSQAAEIGLDYLTRLVQPIPSGTKKALGDAVVNATRGRSRERRAIDSLKTLGFQVTKKGGLFRRRTEVDTGTSGD